MLVIFDCDGVLVDSEPLANTCFSRALQREGLDWTVEETMRRLMGRSMKSCVEIVEGELGRALPVDFVDRLQADTMQTFHDALGLTGLWARFEGRIFSSSQVPRGKPFPDLFLHAAIQMNEQPFDCAVVEDSLPGVQAARAAGMRALAYVGATYSDSAALQAAGGRTFDSMSSLPMLAWAGR